MPQSIIESILPCQSESGMRGKEGKCPVFWEKTLQCEMRDIVQNEKALVGA
jgi:hypothetical protein